MKKNLILFITMLISLSLLTGCGATEEDIANAKNPEKFVKESFENYYKKEIEIISTKEVKDKNDDSLKIMNIQLKDNKDFTFTACSYWEISSPIPTRHYNYINNYEAKYTEIFLNQYFNSEEYGTITFENKKYSYKEECELDYNKATLELNDLSKLDSLQETLNEIKETKEVYSISIDIKYNDQTVTIILNENTKDQENLDKLNSLKNS